MTNILEIKHLPWNKKNTSHNYFQTFGNLLTLHIILNCKNIGQYDITGIVSHRLSRDLAGKKR